MKKLVVKNIQDCANCLTCAAVCAQTYYKTSDLEYAVLNVGSDDQGQIKFDLCTQCGKCAEVCPVGAITCNAQGVYMINRKTCIGCLACMDICPQNVIRKSHENAFATKCIACGVCVRACPMDVLAIETT